MLLHLSNLLLNGEYNRYSIRLTQELPETLKLWAENLYSFPRSFIIITLIKQVIGLFEF